MADPSHPTTAEGIPAQIAGRVESIVRAAEREALAIQREIDAQRRVAESEARHYAEEARRRIEALAQERLDRLCEITDDLAERAEHVRHQLDGLAQAIQAVVAGLGSGASADIAWEHAEMPDPGASTAERQGASAATQAPGPTDPGPTPPPTPATAPIPPSLQVRPGAPGPPIHPEARTAPGPAGIAAAEELPLGVRRRMVPPSGRPRDGDDPWTQMAPGNAPPARERPGEPHLGPAPGDDRADAARLVALEMAVAGRSRLELDRHLREAFGTVDTTAILNGVFGPAPAASPQPPGH